MNDTRFDDDTDDDLKALLRECLHAVAHAAPVIDPSRTPRRAAPRRAQIVKLAAAAVVISGTAGVAIVVTNEHVTAPSSPPTSPPLTTSAIDVAATRTLLAPPDDLSHLQVTSATRHMSSPAWEGAVLADGGEVIGMTVQANPQPFSGGGGYADGEERWIGDQRVVGGIAEGAETGNETYVLEDGCALVAITTSQGLERWADELVEFVENLTISGGAVTIELPPGWQSLGSGAPSEQYGLGFVAYLDTERDYEFILSQRPDTSLGVYLANPGSDTPRPATLLGEPVWLVGDTGGGWSSLAFEHEGTAALLSGLDVTDELLLAMASNLVERPWRETEALVPTTTTPSSGITPPGTGLPATATSIQAEASSGGVGCPISVNLLEPDQPR